MDDLQPISILLLGDDEVGKSTFLSYVFFLSLSLSCKIPSSTVC